MNKLREKIDKECTDLTFNCNIQEFEERYKKRKRKIKQNAISFVAVFIICIASFIFFINQNQQKNTDITKNLFSITAYAAEDSETNSNNNTKKKAYEIINDSNIIIPEFRLEVHEIKQPEKTYKTFSHVGNAQIGAYGNNINTLEFHSEISEFRDKYDECSNIIKINYDDIYPENNTVNWLLPSEVNYWMEKQNEPDYSFKFSDLPTDTVTITATYNDGTKQTKTMKLFFNDYGYLVIKTDSATYNNVTETILNENT